MILPPAADQMIHDTIKAPARGPAPLRVVCAWCGLLMRDGPPDDISHGMCPACAERFR